MAHAELRYDRERLGSSDSVRQEVEVNPNYAEELAFEPITSDNRNRVAREWDDLVGHSPDATIYHTWNWYEILREGLDERPLRWWVRKKSDVIGAASVVRRGLRQGRLGGRLIGAFLYRYWSPSPRSWGYGGPVLAESVDPALRFAVVGKLADLFRREFGCRGSRFAMRNQSNSPANAASAVGARTVTWPTGLVDLRPPEAVIMSSFRKDTKRRIRQAEKAGVEVREGVSTSDVEAFFDGPWRALQGKLEGLPPSPYAPEYLDERYFLSLFGRLRPRKECLLLLATKGSDVLGGCVHLVHGTLAHTQHIAVDPRAPTPVSALLVWESITRLRGAGVLTIDLAGVPDDPQNGVGNFKRGFRPSRSELTWLYF